MSCETDDRVFSGVLEPLELELPPLRGVDMVAWVCWLTVETKFCIGKKE